MRILRSPWPLVAMTVLLIGCGRALDTVPVRGIVTFNGKPVDGAALALMREAGRGPAGFAVTDAEGRFEVRTGKCLGLLPGKYVVTLQKMDSSSLNIPDPLPAGMTVADYMRDHDLAPRSLLPLKYSRLGETPLHIEVLADSDKNCFELNLEGAVSALP